MTTLLKQSTAVDIAMGPFVDSTDGFTPETALTITQPDIRLKKGTAAWAQKNAAQTLTHEENGWYEVALDTTDTNTLGQLVVAIYETGALPVWREFMVVPANIYDSLVAGTATQNANVTALAADVITAASIAAGAIGASEAPNLDAAISTRATPAQVNAEVLDVLNVDTFAEIGQETPAATQTLRKMLGYLYKAWRNRTTQTATTQSIYNDDATTVGQKATVSDDGTTFDKGEIGTGP